MCLLSYFPEGVLPDAEDLANGAYANPDGSGYAIATRGGDLLVRRTFENPEALIERFCAERDRWPEGPALFHSRLGTSGLYSKFNVHPIRVGHDRRTVVAHNGIFFHPAAEEKRSDTRIFAEEIMPRRFRRLDRPAVAGKLEHWLGGFNKIAVITVNPRYRRQGYLFNAKAGMWTAEGAWHSNSSYLPRLAPATPWWDDAAAEGVVAADGSKEWTGPLASLCDYCGMAEVDGATRVCAACKTCQDCGDELAACLCWTPDSKVAATRLAPAEDEPFAGPGGRVWRWVGEQGGWRSPDGEMLFPWAGRD